MWAARHRAGDEKLPPLRGLGSNIAPETKNDLGGIVTIRNFVSFMALVGLTLALPAWAHHSHANYETTQYTHLQGKVTEFHWMNPHTWIFLEVVDAEGQPAIWALEGASPTELRRDGWRQDDVEVGDTISVRCHQLKDESNGCLLGFLTPEGGAEKEWD